MVRQRQIFIPGLYPLPTSWYRLDDVKPRHIPDTSGVYVFLDYRRRVKYVGLTESLRRRFVEHGFSRSDLLGWRRVPLHDLMTVECLWIGSLLPWQNVCEAKHPKPMVVAKEQSARLSVQATSIWKVGRWALVPRKSLEGPIEEIFERCVVVGGLRVPKALVSLVLNE